MTGRRPSQLTTMLWLYVGIDVAILLYTRTVGAGLNESVRLPGQILWLAIDLMLVRAVARGHRAALSTLVALTAVPMVLLVLSLTELTGYAAGLLTMTGIQLLVLTSSTIRRHTMRVRRPGRAEHPLVTDHDHPGSQSTG
ncbi:MAG TPA: hypothetical protein VIR27_19300 [Mycobacteriales bacterium]